MAVTLTTEAKNWLAINAGVSNCFSPSGVSYVVDGTVHVGSTGDVVNAFFVSHLVGLDTTIVIANTDYNGFKTINGGVDIGFDDVNFAYSNDGTTPGISAYCVPPANVISATLTVDRNDCTEPCTVNGTVSWTNNGGIASPPTDLSISYNGNSIPVASAAIINPGETLSYTFSIPGLTVGTYTVQASPNAGTAPQTITVTIALTSVHIVSAPSGATIYIDDIIQPDVTPATISGLTSGLHTYRLTRDGCDNEATGEFTTIVGTTVEVSATFGTTARFTSAPSGARIWIDGVDTGTDTPGTVTVAPGYHTYKLTLATYSDFAGSFTVEICKRKNITASISKFKEMGFGTFMILGLAVGAILMATKKKKEPEKYM